MKFTKVAVSFLSVISFYSSANTIVDAVSAQADVTVSDVSKLSLSVEQYPGLTVDQVKKGNTVLVAKYTLKGTGDLAVRVLDITSASDPHCTTMTGVNNSSNKMEACLTTTNLGKFDIAGVRYFVAAPGEYNIRGGGDNTKGKAGADTYVLKMEAVQYSI